MDSENMNAMNEEVAKAQKKAARLRQIGCHSMADEIIGGLKGNQLSIIANMDKKHRPAGFEVHESVKVATTEQLDLANPPEVIDGVKLKSGDRVFVKNQSNPLENGLYLYNKPFTRTSDNLKDGDVILVLSDKKVEGSANDETVWVYGTIKIKELEPGKTEPDKDAPVRWMLWAKTSEGCIVHDVYNLSEPEYDKSNSHTFKEEGEDVVLIAGKITKPFNFTLKVSAGDKKIAEWIKEYGLKNKENKKLKTIISLSKGNQFIKQYVLDNSWITNFKWADAEGKDFIEVSMDLNVDTIQINEFY